jgi:histidinol dehydrogenase
VQLREVVVPVQRAGCYVPGGRADYPSTVLMTAIPARVAGVPEVVLCVPPGHDGTVPSATLAAAALAGVDEVFRVGGAQAIAAMAYGTASVRAVDVIVGPGNVYVAAAKREVSGAVGIESLAGPSELVVVADESTRVDLVAADLLAQSEHGPDGAAVLVTWSDDVASAVDDAITCLLSDAPARADIEATLAAVGRTVLVDGPEHALAVSNAMAPEHLELMTAEPAALVPLVRNAGAVFCGPWAAAAIGDYVAGVNHVLPTARTARFASALRVDDFRKHVHVVDIDEAALHRIAPYVKVLAEVEGLAEHGRSIALRDERAQP